MWAQAINHKVACRSPQSLTGNAKLRQSLAYHPTAVLHVSGKVMDATAPNCNAAAAGRTSAASGCTITAPVDHGRLPSNAEDTRDFIMLRDVLVRGRDTRFCNLRDRAKDWNINNAVVCR